MVRQLPDELKKYLVYPSGSAGEVEEQYETTAYECGLKTFCCALACLPACSCFKHTLIEQGKIATAWESDQPVLIGPGRHCIYCPTTTLQDIRARNEPYIQHGTLHLIRVSPGSLGYGIEAGVGPRLFAVGYHVINSATLTWMGIISFREQVTQIDQMTVVRVETGECAYKITYKAGEGRTPDEKGALIILNPGIHVITPPEQYKDIINTSQQVMQLPPTEHQSADYVGLRVKADIYYQIVEPYKALTMVDDWKGMLRDIGNATLAGIIRSSSLSDIASSSNVSHGGGVRDPANTTAAPAYGEEPASEEAEEAKKVGFYEHAHDQFMSKVHDQVLRDWGIDISNIRIEEIKIVNSQLEMEVSKNAIDSAQKDQRFRMLEKDKIIIEQEAENMKRQLEIQTQADVLAQQMLTDQKSNSIIQMAKAEKEALVLKGEGEQAFADSVSSTQLGQQKALLSIQKEALQGLNKVAYVPHLPGLLQQSGAMLGSDVIMPK